MVVYASRKKKTLTYTFFGIIILSVQQTKIVDKNKMFCIKVCGLVRRIGLVYSR